MGYGSSGSMSAGDFPNGWVNSDNTVWYKQSVSSSSIPWDVTYPNLGDVTWIDTTPSITINPGITVYPQPQVEPQQLEIDWEAVRRSIEQQQARVGLNPPPPVQKKVVPRKPLRMIRLREDAKKS